MRTLYLTFKQNDWQQQLRNNYSSKTDIKADLTVDNQTYKRVGIRFKGNTSYSGPASRNSQKLPFNIEIDYINTSQRLYGYKTLNLNNGWQDPTFLKEAKIPINEIACQLGYTELSNFTHAFVRWTGCSPTEFREELVRGGNSL